MRSFPQSEIPSNQNVHGSAHIDCAIADGVCSVHGETVRKALAEVIALRGRVAQLEQVLVESEESPATPAASQTAPLVRVVRPVESDPEVFAAGWTRENASIDERFAAQTFFDTEAVDERSRRWFLKSS